VRESRESINVTLTHIVAMAENRVIGRAGGIPWHISEDFKFFKRTTMGHALVVGRKTFESFGRPLPGRLNVVVTRGPAAAIAAAANVRVVPDLEAALALCRAVEGEWGSEVFVAGGGEIYRQTIASVSRIYLTVVHQRLDGDTVYPEFDAAQFSRRLLLEAQEPIPYSTYLYERLSTAPALST
jgi:dihydrofolate reductase